VATLEPEVSVDADQIAALKTLTDATRLRIVGLLAAGPATVEGVVDVLGIRRSEAVRQLGLLRAMDVVRGGDGTPFEIRLDTLQGLGRALDDLHRAAEGREAAALSLETGLPAEEAKVLRAFIVDGRLASIPASEKKRRVILRYLRERCFPEDRDYPEKEVNQRLALFNRDVASLRRYLVDSKLMTRDAGVYRRTG
jgi:hypothetical protein